MSHSDSEVRCEKMRLRKSLHFEFKRKKKNNELYRLVRSRFCPIMDELRLLEAVNVNNGEQVERLLRAGVNPNTTDVQNRSVLHIAVSRSYAAIVRLLLQHGADPNRKDVLQNTPLHLAACTYNLPITTMLIHYGADLGSVDIRGRNPIELARSKLQLLHKNWREGCGEMSDFKAEIKQIIDMLLTIWMRKPRNAAITHKPSSVDDLQFMALSLNDDDELDCEMSKLLSEMREISIS